MERYSIYPYWLFIQDWDQEQRILQYGKWDADGSRISSGDDPLEDFVKGISPLYVGESESAFREQALSYEADDISCFVGKEQVCFLRESDTRGWPDVIPIEVYMLLSYHGECECQNRDVGFMDNKFYIIAYGCGNGFVGVYAICDMTKKWYIHHPGISNYREDRPLPEDLWYDGIYPPGKDDAVRMFRLLPELLF